MSKVEMYSPSFFHKKFHTKVCDYAKYVITQSLWIHSVFFIRNGSEIYHKRFLFFPKIYHKRFLGCFLNLLVCGFFMAW